jgi:hypothetical protein
MVQRRQPSWSLQRFFILLAIAGVIPSRIKSGEHEIEMLEDAVIPLVDAAAEQMDRRKLEQFAEALAEEAPTPIRQIASERTQQNLRREIDLEQTVKFACAHAGVSFRESEVGTPCSMALFLTEFRRCRLF